MSININPIFNEGVNPLIAPLITPLITGGTSGSIQFNDNNLLNGDINVMYYDKYNTGNIGIGTSFPTERLHVFDNTNNINVLKVEQSNGGDSAAAQIDCNNDLGNTAVLVCTSSGFNVYPFPDTAVIAGNNTSGGLVLYTNVGDITLIPNTTTKTSKDIEITDNTQGFIIKSPDGTRFRITVDNSGVLITSAI